MREVTQVRNTDFGETEIKQMHLYNALFLIQDIKVFIEMIS